MSKCTTCFRGHVLSEGERAHHRPFNSASHESFGHGTRQSDLSDSTPYRNCLFDQPRQPRRFAKLDELRFRPAPDVRFVKLADSTDAYKWESFSVSDSATSR